MLGGGLSVSLHNPCNSFKTADLRDILSSTIFIDMKKTFLTLAFLGLLSVPSFAASGTGSVEVHKSSHLLIKEVSLEKPIFDSVDAECTVSVRIGFMKIFGAKVTATAENCVEAKKMLDALVDEIKG